MSLSKRRKLLRALLLTVLGVVIVMAALPIWFPWVLRPMAKHFGATYAHYEREGYQRFGLAGLAFTNRSGRFEAKQVEAYLPTVWLWREFIGSASAPFLQVDSWNWQAGPAGAHKTTSATRPPSACRMLQSVASKVGTLEQWLPRAELSHGTLRLKGQTLQIPNAVWASGKLSAQLLVPRFKKTFQLSLAARSLSPPELNLNLAAAEFPFHSRLIITAAEQQVSVQGTAFWLSNRMALKATLPAHGFLPDTASLRANAFKIPAHLLKLKGFQDLTGSVNARWETNQFRFNLSAKALSSSSDLPPIGVEMQANGNLHSAQIDVVSISAPWLNASLAHPARIRFGPPYLEQPATLDATADLAEQPWFAAQGKLAGKMVFLPDTTRFPRADFTVNGSGLSLSNLTAKTLELKGNLQWPQLELTQADMELADGSTFSATGGFNLKKRTVQDGQLRFAGGFGRRYLPSALAFRTASLAMQFAGPLSALTNSATLNVEGLQFPRTSPMHLKANWQGRGLNLRQMQLALSAGDSRLQLRGSAQLGWNKEKLHVTALELSRGQRTELQLQQPFAAAFQRKAPVSSNAWMLAIQPIQWAGGGSELRMQGSTAWPLTGTFEISAQHLNSSLFQNFLEGSTPEAALNHLTLAGGWTNSPMAFHLDSRAEWKAKDKLTFDFNATVNGGANGISLQRLAISSGTQTVCHVEGSLPITLDPGGTNGFVQIHQDSALHLSAATQTNAVLWKEIADTSGLLFIKPQLQANVDGTWAKPRGQIALQAQRIQFPRVQRPLPTLEKLDLAAEINRGEARISRFQVLVQGQPVEFTAQMPLQAHFWSTLASHKTLPDWRQATAHLSIQNAQLAPFAKLAPSLLSPQGAVQADLTLQPGGILKGALVITNVATLPLAGLGSVRRIQAALVFAGQTAELTNFSAAIGGEMVRANGRMPLNAQTWRDRGLPPFVIHLRGTNVPLVRKPSLLLRADLDLALTNPATGPGIVAGNVTLRDSLFLANLQSLIPENAAAPTQHPPYFNVTARPWDRWHLNLQVQGNKFMRVQTPVFHGKVSAAMKLQGTLGNPLALGEIKIASGAVTFPFGNLNVDQGFISLTSDNPYHPRLFITAQAQQFGYNIKLEVTGSANAPVVQFSATPPLSSQDVVLMLTTGQLPAGTGFTTSTRQRAQGLALFFGKNLLSEFGFDLGNHNRLTFRSGQQISEAGRPTYEVNYKLSKRWSLVGQYDRFDQYDLNLKWNIYSK